MSEEFDQDECVATYISLTTTSTANLTTAIFEFNDLVGRNILKHYLLDEEHKSQIRSSNKQNLNRLKQAIGYLTTATTAALTTCSS